MAATIIVEDGTGVADANCYFTIDELTAYYEAHPYAAVVTALSADMKIRCSIGACRKLDVSSDIRGMKVAWDQDMEWPRLGVVIDVDPAAAAGVGAVVITGDENVLATGAGAIPGNVVPKRWKQACMELVRFEAIKDRDVAFDKPAVVREKIDVIEREFTKDGAGFDLIPEIVQRMVKPFTIAQADAGGPAGSTGGGARAVRLVRG